MNIDSIQGFYKEPLKTSFSLKTQEGFHFLEFNNSLVVPPFIQTKQLR